MRDLNDLYYFVQVVDYGGFAAAARATEMQKSKLSRRVLQLEDRLGVRLVNRSTRSFSVTGIGRDYYDRCSAMLAHAEAADEGVAAVRAKPRGTIRINCSAGLLNYGFGTLFARFLARNSTVEIVLDNLSRRVDVIAERFDLVIRAQATPSDTPGLMMQNLADIKMCLVAAPSLLQGQVIRSPRDLTSLPSIAQGPSQQDYCWSLKQSNGPTELVSFSPRFTSDDIPAVIDAAVSGVGIVRLPATAVERELKTGQLVHALPGWDPSYMNIHAVFPTQRGITPSVRLLLDFLAAECSTHRLAGKA